MDYVSFQSASFRCDGGFINTLFSADGNFTECHFEGVANFSSSHFASYVYFSSSNFASDVYFSSSHFANAADFGFSNFAGDADFSSSHFACDADFSSRHFEGDANFSSVEMNGQTSFEDATFKTHVPIFHAAKLYRDTVFPTAEPASLNYPEIMPAGKEQVGDTRFMPATEQKRAYNTLRYFMNQNLEIYQELFFHRREMACKEVTEDAFVGWLIWFYGRLSAYGSSIARPLMGLVGIWFVGALLLQFHFTSDPELSIMGDFWSAMGISFSNTFGIFGLGGTLLSEFNADTEGWIKGVSGFQTVFGFIFLFLLGLGIRSRFRLR